MLETILGLIASAFGRALADMLQTWLSNQDAIALGAQKQAATDSAAVADMEARYAQNAVDIASRGLPGVIDRLRHDQF